jgi:hypothetical protein
MKTRRSQIQKTLSASETEHEMLKKIAVVYFDGNQSKAIREMVAERANKTRGKKFDGEFLKDEIVRPKSLTWVFNNKDLKNLNALSIYYGRPEREIFHHVIRSFYAEYQRAIESALAYAAYTAESAAMTETPVEIEKPAEVEAEPTATQMPLPEPEAEAIAMRIEAERMHDDGEFRADLLKVLGRIADGLALMNEGRIADSAEIGKIANQLRTLNNAVWNR